MTRGFCAFVKSSALAKANRAVRFGGVFWACEFVARMLCGCAYRLSFGAWPDVLNITGSSWAEGFVVPRERRRLISVDMAAQMDASVRKYVVKTNEAV